eukprot:TRINITY_DN10663_c0_g1_i1.p1 TRINITY_DN10663_c0_g1~~TRINITY_DN10663_c0_g1_i1.p1  ORF type:complete len:182 (+),score=23.29 TRINITY_DN10663_c0_g1_i1:43-546(+)
MAIMVAALLKYAALLCPLVLGASDATETTAFSSTDVTSAALLADDPEVEHPATETSAEGEPEEGTREAAVPRFLLSVVPPPRRCVPGCVYSPDQCNRCICPKSGLMARARCTKRACRLACVPGEIYPSPDGRNQCVCGKVNGQQRRVCTDVDCATCDDYSTYYGYDY